MADELADDYVRNARNCMQKCDMGIEQEINGGDRRAADLCLSDARIREARLSQCIIDTDNNQVQAINPTPKEGLGVSNFVQDPNVHAIKPKSVFLAAFLLDNNTIALTYLTI